MSNRRKASAQIGHMEGERPDKRNIKFTELAFRKRPRAEATPLSDQEWFLQRIVTLTDLGLPRDEPVPVDTLVRNMEKRFKELLETFTIIFDLLPEEVQHDVIRKYRAKQE